MSPVLNSPNIFTRQPNDPRSPPIPGTSTESRQKASKSRPKLITNDATDSSSSGRSCSKITRRTSSVRPRPDATVIKQTIAKASPKSLVRLDPPRATMSPRSVSSRAVPTTNANACNSLTNANSLKKEKIGLTPVVKLSKGMPLDSPLKKNTTLYINQRTPVEPPSKKIPGNSNQIAPLESRSQKKTTVNSNQGTPLEPPSNRNTPKSSKAGKTPVGANSSQKVLFHASPMKLAGSAKGPRQTVGTPLKRNGELLGQLDGTCNMSSGKRMKKESSFLEKLPEGKGTEQDPLLIDDLPTGRRSGRILIPPLAWWANQRVYVEPDNERVSIVSGSQNAMSSKFIHYKSEESLKETKPASGVARIKKANEKEKKMSKSFGDVEIAKKKSSGSKSKYGSLGGRNTTTDDSDAFRSLNFNQTKKVLKSFSASSSRSSPAVELKRIKVITDNVVVPTAASPLRTKKISRRVASSEMIAPRSNWNVSDVSMLSPSSTTNSPYRSRTQNKKIVNDDDEDRRDLTVVLFTDEAYKEDDQSVGSVEPYRLPVKLAAGTKKQVNVKENNSLSVLRRRSLLDGRKAVDQESQQRRDTLSNSRKLKKIKVREPLRNVLEQSLGGSDYFVEN